MSFTSEKYIESHYSLSFRILPPFLRKNRTQKRRNNGEFPVSLSLSVIKDDRQNVVSVVGVVRDISQRKQAEEEREKLIAELQSALAEVKTLTGFIPICAACKKIRDDQGYWNQIEAYVQEHSNAEFSHSICPDCIKELYPDLYERYSN